MKLLEISIQIYSYDTIMLITGMHLTSFLFYVKIADNIQICIYNRENIYIFCIDEYIIVLQHEHKYIFLKTNVSPTL